MLTYPDPPLHDGVVALRPWSDDDLACVAEASTDPAIPEGTTVPVPYTPAEGRAFVARQHARHRDGQGVSLAVVEVASETARGIVVVLRRPTPGTVAVGYWVVASTRGRGLAGRAVRLAARWAVTQHDVARVEAMVEPTNLASQRVLAGAGFQREGLLRSYVAFATRRADAEVWSLLPGDEG